MFDPPDHSVCQSISFVLYVQFRIRSFNVMCLQLIYNYLNFTSLIQISGKDLRPSLCKILISSFTHKIDFAHNFSVDFFE